MKLLWSLLISILLLTNSAYTVKAQTSQNSPTPAPQMASLEDNQASASGMLNSFFSSFDWISSGLIFNTPNLMDNSIKLSDGTVLSGISEFRTIFFDIAIPLYVIIISFIAMTHITNDNKYQLTNFLKRLAFVVGLSILTPYILSYSIQFINLLNNKINAQNSFNIAGFILSFLNSGDLYKLLGLGMGPFGFIGTIFTSPGTIMQLIVLIVSFGFFLLGFLYIVFQAIFRFLALLILSVLYPLVLPFALAGKTENIANTYFKTWFTFLIQQPAFVLGFAIVSAILGSIMKAHGGNIGTLFLYSGALIFLGGVNIFIGRIFGDGWSMLATNFQSMAASGAITGFGAGTLRELKRGAVTGRASGFRSYAGMHLGNKIRSYTTNGDNSNDNNGSQKPPHFSTKFRKAGNWAKSANNDQPATQFAKEINNHGIKTQVIDKKQGIIHMKGTGYSYTDHNSGLTTTYISKEDALSSGRKEHELKPSKIDHRIVDHSYFNKDYPIPYGAEAIKNSKKGYTARSYLGSVNHPKRVKEYLDLSREDLRKNNATGLLMKQFDTPGDEIATKKTIRIYSTEPL